MARGSPETPRHGTVTLLGAPSASVEGSEVRLYWQQALLLTQLVRVIVWGRGSALQLTTHRNERDVKGEEDME